MAGTKRKPVSTSGYSIAIEANVTLSIKFGASEAGCLDVMPCAARVGVETFVVQGGWLCLSVQADLIQDPRCQRATTFLTRSSGPDPYLSIRQKNLLEHWSLSVPLLLASQLIVQAFMPSQLSNWPANPKISHGML